MTAFTLGLESLGKPPISMGEIPPSEDVVNVYFNDSTGKGKTGNGMPADRGTKAAIGSSSRRQPLKDSTAGGEADPGNDKSDRAWHVARAGDWIQRNRKDQCAEQASPGSVDQGVFGNSLMDHCLSGAA